LIGFDTHADERGPQQELLAVVDEALAPFLREMSTDAHGKDVVVMVYSAFGRRVAANASQGTDHGTAGPVLIAGQPVKGGFYGEQPSLTDLDDGDLKGTMDSPTSTTSFWCTRSAPIPYPQSVRVAVASVS
jgi:uncharacterized protein (DUF1501 family)